MNFRMIGQVIGRVLCIEAALMLLPMVAALAYGESPAPFLITIAVTGGIGGIPLWLAKGLFARELSALLILFPKIEPYTVYLRAGTVLAVSLLAALWPRNVIRRMDDFRPTWYSCLYVLIPAAWSILSFTGVVTFIYSNF